MLTNYYTLRALVAEWTPALTGSRLGDAFSQVRDELTLAFATPETTWMLRFGTAAPDRFVFRTEGYSRARRNVATLFEEAFDQMITAVWLAERDRVLGLNLDGGGRFQVHLFGPRANIFLVDAEGIITEAFQADADWAGQPAPAPRPAPTVATFADFAARWRTNRKTADQALAAALPLFDRMLAKEVLHRSGLPNTDPAACSEADQQALFAAAETLRSQLAAPRPCLYWDGRFAEAFSLVPLQHLGHLREERFETVDQAVQVFVRRMLGQQRFRATYQPLEKALAQAAQHYRTSSARMLEALTEESRADRYEQWGHLLMASPQAVPPRAEEVTLPNLFADNAPTTLPLDPQLSAIENAQRYYAKAKQTRQARAHAEDRLVATEARAETAEALLAELRTLEHTRDVERFQKDQAEALAPFLSGKAAQDDRLPFRRYLLPQGYEVWVGRNAKQNDQLTFRHARKYDLWLHARGVPGSHTLLRLPSRQAEPPRPVLEAAAAIAAFHSKARGTGLAPVIVTPRKHVRKAKNGPPGAVLVDREAVLIVEPGVPG